jgi:hypothetical protein
LPRPKGVYRRVNFILMGGEENRSLTMNTSVVSIWARVIARIIVLPLPSFFEDYFDFWLLVRSTPFHDYGLSQGVKTLEIALLSWLTGSLLFAMEQQKG